MSSAPLNSLVKYEPPVLVNTTKKLDKKGVKPGVPAPRKGADAKGGSQTEDILNSILPPREWTDEGQLWVQYVSSNPATRLDVINLQELLDQRLQQRQARETGICPVREELYAQTFGARAAAGRASRARRARARAREVAVACSLVGRVALRQPAGRADHTAGGTASNWGACGVARRARARPAQRTRRRRRPVATGRPPSAVVYAAAARPAFASL